MNEQQFSDNAVGSIINDAADDVQIVGLDDWVDDGRDVVVVEIDDDGSIDDAAFVDLDSEDIMTDDVDMADADTPSADSSVADDLAWSSDGSGVDDLMSYDDDGVLL